MTLPARRKQSSSEGTRVLQFPRPGGFATDSRSLAPLAASQLPRLGQLKEELRTVVEVFMTEAYVAGALEGAWPVSTPFDAIYISRLGPDQVHAADIEKLRRLSAVVDLSDQLEFDDEWRD